MYYIWTLDSHELYGPFDGKDECTAFAFTRSLSSYTIYSWDELKSYMFELFRKVS